jgi:hypothetical protein
LNKEIKKSYIISYWFCVSFAIFSIMLLFYTFYLSILFYENLRTEHYLKYQIIFFLSSLFWFFTLYLKNEIRLNITIIFLSFITSTYLIEGLLNIIKSPIERSEIAIKQKKDFDTRSRLEIYKDLTAKDQDIVLSFYPASLLDQNKITTEDSLFPLSGISDRKTIYSNESGEYYINKTDRYGFNNPDAEWSKDVEWLLIGDSFAEGGAVSKKENISARIRKLTGSAVINLGRGGNGPLIELGTLKEYGELLSPKKILWLYYEGNDLINLSKEKHTPALINYLTDGYSQNLINKQDQVNKFVTENWKINKSSLGIGLNFIKLPKIRRLIRIDSQEVDFKIDPLFGTILKKARDRASEKGGEFYFIYLPEFYRYKSNISVNDYRKKSDVIKLVKSLNIPVIDIHKELFVKQVDPLSLFPFGTDGHYTAETDKRIAEIIITLIEETQTNGGEGGIRTLDRG